MMVPVHNDIDRSLFPVKGQLDPAQLFVLQQDAVERIGAAPEMFDNAIAEDELYLTKISTPGNAERLRVIGKGVC
jgi:hypothetical protein